nr:unnamed protein product [uncultured bacterium]
MFDNFFSNLSSITEPDSYIVDQIGSSTTIIITKNFNLVSLHILNLFGKVGVKFKIVTGFKENKIFEIQISIETDEIKKINTFLNEINKSE